jgi:hypothetical protein
MSHAAIHAVRRSVMLNNTDDTEPTGGDPLVFATLVPPDHDLRRVT